MQLNKRMVHSDNLLAPVAPASRFHRAGSLFVLLVILALILPPKNVEAQNVYTWDGSTGPWFEAERWGPSFDTVPSGGDIAIVGSGGATLSGNASVLSLDFSGGVIQAVGLDFSANSSGSNWLGGTFFGPGTTTFNGVTIGGGQLQGGRTLQLWGATNAQQGTLTVGGNSTIENQGNFSIGSGANIVSVGPSTIFNNSGAFEKTAGIISDVGTVFNNNAFVSTTGGGRLVFSGGGTHTGNWSLISGDIEFGGNSNNLFETGTNISGNANQSLIFAEGVHEFNGGVYNLGGTTRIDGGTINFNSQATTSQLEIVSSGSFVGGPSELTVNNMFSWQEGGLRSANVQANGGINIFGGVHELRNQSDLRSSGITTWSSGEIRNGSDSTFTNQVGGIFSITGDDDYTNGLSGQNSTFVNEGLLSKAQGTGVTEFFNVAFNNSGGLVSVASGTLRLRGGGTSDGAWSAASNGTLEFAGGTHELNFGTDVSGAGVVDFSGGTTNFNGGTYDVTGLTRLSGGRVSFHSDATTANLEINTPLSFVSGGATLSTSQNFDWTAGGIDGGVVAMLAGSRLNISAGIHELRGGATVNNSGNADWQGGEIRNGSASTFNNLALGVFSVESNSRYTNGLGGPFSEFNNAGTFIKTSSNGTTTFENVAFNNSGRVTAESGIIDFSTYSQTMTGTLELRGGNVLSDNTFQVSGGQIIGTGTIYGNVNANAVIAPGFSAGEITVEGDLLLGFNSELQLEIGGLVQSSEYDFIDVVGEITLDGLLSLDVDNGFESGIQAGDTFTLVSALDLFGEFTNVSSGQSIVTNGIRFDVFYGSGSQFGSNNVVAVATAVPEPGGGLVLLTCLVCLFGRRSRPVGKV